MSTFNKLFTGSVLTAALVALVHTGTWALRTSRTLDAAQALAVAPVIAMSANGTVASQSSDSADSCAKTSRQVAH